MADAINESLGKKEPAKPAPTEDEDADPAADAGEDGDADADGGDGDADGNGADAAGDADDGDSSDGGAADAGADGSGEGGGEGEGAGEGGEDGEGEDPADPFEAPKGLKERSAKRWKTIADRAKTAEAGLTNFQNALKDTGAPREAIARSLYVLKLMHSGTADGLREALEILDRNRASIAKALGIEVPGVDLLGDYPDLAKQVEDAQISREHALELAGARRLKSNQEEGARRANQDRDRETQLKAARDAAFGQLDALGEELSKNDVDYDAKFEILKSNGDIQDITESFPPNKWAEQFRRRYQLLGKAGGGGQQRTVTRQPLRSNGTGGKGTAAPKTMSDAIRGALTATTDNE